MCKLKRDEFWRRDALSLVITLPECNTRQLLAVVAVNFIPKNKELLFTTI